MKMQTENTASGGGDEVRDQRWKISGCAGAGISCSFHINRLPKTCYLQTHVQIRTITWVERTLSPCILARLQSRASLFFPYLLRRRIIQPVKHNPKKISGSYGIIPLTDSHVSLIIFRENLNWFQFLSHAQTYSIDLYKPLTARCESAPNFQKSEKSETVQERTRKTDGGDKRLGTFAISLGTPYSFIK